MNLSLRLYLALPPRGRSAHLVAEGRPETFCELPTGRMTIIDYKRLPSTHGVCGDCSTRLSWLQRNTDLLSDAQLEADPQNPFSK